MEYCDDDREYIRAKTDPDLAWKNDCTPETHVTMATLTRIGHPWTKEEETSILAAVEAGKTIAEIAADKQRTTGSIRARLERIACCFVEEKKMSLYEAAGRTGLRVARIQEALKRKTEEEFAKKVCPPPMEFNFQQTFTREKLQGRAEEMKRSAEAAARLQLRKNVQYYVDHCIQSAVLEAAATTKTSYLYDLTKHQPGSGYTPEDLVRGLQEKFPECIVTLAEEWVDVPNRPGQPPTRTLKSGIKIDWS